MAGTRAAKSCGPDAPTLASSFAESISVRRWWQTSPVTKESAKETVKTIARGMPGDFRCNRGDDTRVLPTHCTRGYGRIGRPAFPAPSVFEERNYMQSSGANVPRECGGTATVS